MGRKADRLLQRDQLFDLLPERRSALWISTHKDLGVIGMAFLMLNLLGMAFLMLNQFQLEPRRPSIVGSTEKDSQEGFTEVKEVFF